jgi:aminoglycoside 2'-N-acetyltransferase I
MTRPVGQRQALFRENLETAMAELRVAHTADLDAASLDAARALLEDVFVDDFTEHDWEHALGGIHAIVWEGSEPIAHASVVQRRLITAGRTLRCGYVEAVAVGADFRRRGVGTALMRGCNRIVRGAYHLGALGATDEAVRLYEASGWKRWEGPLSALTPDGVVRTPDEEGFIYVLEAFEPLDLTAELTCDWREGDVW